MIPWSPLPPGRPTRDWEAATERSSTEAFGRTLYAATTDADRRAAESVSVIADERGVLRSQIVFARVLAKQDVSAPIIRASEPTQLAVAIAAIILIVSDDDIAGHTCAFAATAALLSLVGASIVLTAGPLALWGQVCRVFNPSPRLDRLRPLAHARSAKLPGALSRVPESVSPRRV